MQQDFEDRWQKAKVLVIGAAYAQSEYDRWSKIDANYIGFGKNYEIDVQGSVKITNNPFAKDWNANGLGAWTELVLKAQKDGKKFDNIFLDVSVDKFISSDMMLAMLATIGTKLLQPQGTWYVPDKSSSLPILPDNFVRMTLEQQEIARMEARKRNQELWHSKFTRPGRRHSYKIVDTIYLDTPMGRTSFWALQPTKQESSLIQMSTNCHSCKLTPTRLVKCGFCKDALYCGQKCADAHWDIHKWSCALIEGGQKRTIEDDARLSDCTNDRDPITLRKLHKFEPNAIVKLNIYGQLQCFDVEGLVAWMQVNPTNPLTNEPFTAEQLQQITNANVQLVEERARALEARNRERYNRVRLAYARSLEERFPGVPTIQVFWKLNKTRTLTTVPQETTDVILRYIADCEGIENPNRIWIYNVSGRQFNADTTLEKLGIGANSTLDILGKFGYIPPWTGVPSFL